MKGDRVRKKLLICATVLIALLSVACGGGDNSSDTTGGDTGGGGSAALTAENFSFSPTSLTVAAGGSIEYTNNDDTEHNFSIDDAGIDQDVEGGASATVDLSSVDPGTYDFYCKYHKDKMTGTLEVTG
jgi:plastocyanin